MTQFGPDAPHRVVDHVVALAQQTASEVWTDGLPELMEMDLRHAVPRIHVPALVVVGELDRVTPPAAAIELAGALPDGRLVVLDGAGHIPMLERPVELERELRTFAGAALGQRSRSRHAEGDRPKTKPAEPSEGGGRRMTRTLAEVAAEAAGCTRCRLAETRTQVVFGVGNPNADLMFIGEAPGFHEDKEGEPFVGAAGQLLTRMLGEIGLAREDVYIANVLQLPAARQPRPSARRDRGLHAVARRDALAGPAARRS